MYTLGDAAGERCTDSEAGPEAPSRGWSGGLYSSGVTGYVTGVPGVCQQGPTHEKRVHIPGRAYLVLELPECA